MNQLTAAFPAALSNQVMAAVAALGPARHSIAATYPAYIRGERLELPARIYNDEKNLATHKLALTENEILHCLLSRHHNGHVRQQHITHLYGSSNIWAAPFVLLLLGEYVIEILLDLEQHLGEIQKPTYREMLLENPDLWDKTQQRVISYWSCYYRRIYPRREDYVGFRLLRYFQDLLN